MLVLGSTWMLAVLPSYNLYVHSQLMHLAHTLCAETQRKFWFLFSIHLQQVHNS